MLLDCYPVYYNRTEISEVRKYSGESAVVAPPPSQTYHTEATSVIIKKASLFEISLARFVRAIQIVEMMYRNDFPPYF